MATLQIPVRNDLPAYQMRVELDGELFELSFRYNLRMTRWIMDILDSEENPIVIGIPLLTNVDLFKRYKDERLPQGTMLLFEEQGLDDNAEREDLAQSHFLLYSEAAA